MKNAFKITTYVIILLGGTISFAYWSTTNFNIALSDIEKNQNMNLANIIPVEKPENTLQEEKLATTTPEVVFSGDLNEFKYIFPEKPTDVYKGCEYEISWSNIGVNSIDISLVDAGTREVMGPVTSGIPKNLTGENIENYKWKVGNVWPGKYYILATNINSTEVQKKSASVNVISPPSDLSQTDIATFCESKKIQ